MKSCRHKEVTRMKDYHYAWLSVHPDRTEEWLADKLKDGFGIHHLDGDHGNNSPENLVLLDWADHSCIAAEGEA